MQTKKFSTQEFAEYLGISVSEAEDTLDRAAKLEDYGPEYDACDPDDYDPYDYV